MLGSFKFLAGERKWRAKCADVHAIIDSLIDDEITLHKRTESEELDGKADTPYKYILLRELVKQTHDRRFIRNEVMNIYFPARDTAGILTSDILFLLARHPDVWSKLRAGVLGIGEQKLTFELLKSLKYTHAVINESAYFFSLLSHSPFLPFLFRKSVELIVCKTKHSASNPP